MLPVAMAQSSSGGVAICYVLPVLWMTSRLPIIGQTRRRSGVILKGLTRRLHVFDTAADTKEADLPRGSTGPGRRSLMYTIALLIHSNRMSVPRAVR